MLLKDIDKHMDFCWSSLWLIIPICIFNNKVQQVESLTNLLKGTLLINVALYFLFFNIENIILLIFQDNYVQYCNCMNLWDETTVPCALPNHWTQMLVYLVKLFWLECDFFFYKPNEKFINWKSISHTRKIQYQVPNLKQ